MRQIFRELCEQNEIVKLDTRENPVFPSQITNKY